MKKYKCKAKNCGKEFYSKYRRDYCPSPENACYKSEKKARQSLIDGLVKKIKTGLYSNYKYFHEILPVTGEATVDYDKALKNGFDENAYYGTYINQHEDRWHKVGDYFFTISHKDEMRLLHLFKK